MNENAQGATMEDQFAEKTATASFYIDISNCKAKELPNLFKSFGSNVRKFQQFLGKNSKTPKLPH